MILDPDVWASTDAALTAQVENASASRPARKSVPEVPQDEDVEMVSEPEPVEPEPEEDEEMEDIPKPKPRKKKEKKVIPVGRNGLKKKRVMKSRMTMDAKGYMGTGRMTVAVSMR